MQEKDTERKHDDDDNDPGNKGVQLAIYQSDVIRKQESGGEIQKSAAVKAAAATGVVAGLAAFFSAWSILLYPIPGVLPASPKSAPTGFNSGT